MNEQDKKTALRMIPYGIYVMTAKAGDGSLAAATVNWVTQTAFSPPLLAIGVKVDSGVYAAVKESGQFALNVLGKGQQQAAFSFFKPAKVEDGKLSGEPFYAGTNGAPILENAQSSVECKVVHIVELGDHHTVIGEVTDAKVLKAPAGRPDEAVLEMKDLGETVFYGG
jgi:flavin reductase (DIM6/NTAB) family NADH-FMN oxidoreductase RutF